MKLWPVAPFLSLTFGIWEHTKHCSMSLLYSSTRNDMLQCFVCSPIPKVSEKKWATGESFIRKEITSYRIGTLVSFDLSFQIWIVFLEVLSVYRLTMPCLHFSISLQLSTFPLMIVIKNRITESPWFQSLSIFAVGNYWQQWKLKIEFISISCNTFLSFKNWN